MCDRLRPVLPLLLAISANSPYLDARDSGLHSARTQTFTKRFPRCGIPDSFGSWAGYRDYVEFLVQTNSIVEYTQVWWSIRPHFCFGTVEVRICDAQSTAQEAEALAGADRRRASRRPRATRTRACPFTDPARRLIEENFWRAIRHGLDGRMIDLDRAEEFPAAAAPERLLQWTAPVRAELGIEPAFPAANGAQRQRRAIAAGADMHDVYAAAVEGDARDLRAGGEGRMSEQAPPPTGDPNREPTEEELRAYGERLRQIRVEDIIVETIGPLLNIGTLRAGLVPGHEEEADLDQLRKAIEAARALLPLIEPRARAAGGRRSRARSRTSRWPTRSSRAAGRRDSGRGRRGRSGRGSGGRAAVRRRRRAAAARAAPPRTTSSPASRGRRSAPGASGSRASSPPRATTAGAGTPLGPRSAHAAVARSNANGGSVRFARYHHRRS